MSTARLTAKQSVGDIVLQVILLILISSFLWRNVIGLFVWFTAKQLQHLLSSKFKLNRKNWTVNSLQTKWIDSTVIRILRFQVRTPQEHHVVF